MAYYGQFVGLGKLRSLFAAQIVGYGACNTVIEFREAVAPASFVGEVEYQLGIQLSVHGASEIVDK